MTITLPELEPWQLDVFKRIQTKPKDTTLVVKARRQCGKSVLAVVILIWYSLTSKGTSIVVEPTLNQSRRVFKQLCDMLEGSGVIKSANASLLYVEFVNGSEVLFKSAEQKDSLRGMTASHILIIDEAAFIPDDVFDILFPVVDAHRAPILMLSTPLFADGYFYRNFNDKGNLVYDWAGYDTSKYLSKEKLEHYAKTMPAIRYRTEYLAQFITSGGYVFTDYRFSTSTAKPVCCGIDWSTGTGGDYTWLTFLDSEGNTTSVWRTNSMKPTEQIQAVSRLLAQSGVSRVMVETNSIGEVYRDMLKGSLPPSVALLDFSTTNESKRRIVENLQKALADGTCTAYDDTELRAQLQAYACERTPSGKITYNAATGHDDGVMSLAIALECLRTTHGNYSFGNIRRR